LSKKYKETKKWRLPEVEAFFAEKYLKTELQERIVCGGRVPIAAELTSVHFGSKLPASVCFF